jgi:hypothetical protein
MALTDQVIMPGSDYQAICDATRSLTGKTGVLKSGDISTELGTITPKTEMWILNGEGKVPKDMRFNVDFVSKDRTTKFISIALINNVIYYLKADNTSVYVAAIDDQISETEFHYSWQTSDARRQMIFSVPPHGELLTWLQQNAKKVTSSADTNLKDEISFAPSSNETILDYSDSAIDGLKKVTVAGVPAETKKVALSMTSGNQIIDSTSGKYMTQVTVEKPSTLIPSNIKKDVNIGGVVGAIPEITANVLLDKVSANSESLNVTGDTATLNVHIFLDPNDKAVEGNMILPELGTATKPVTVPTEILVIDPEWHENSSYNSYPANIEWLIRKVQVYKPTGLIPSNIKKGAYVGGIVGTFEGGGGVDLPFTKLTTVSTNNGIISFSFTGDYKTIIAKRSGTNKILTAVFGNNLKASFSIVSSGADLSTSSGFSYNQVANKFNVTWNICESSGSVWYEGSYDIYGCRNG